MHPCKLDKFYSMVCWWCLLFTYSLVFGSAWHLFVPDDKLKGMLLHWTMCKSLVVESVTKPSTYQQMLGLVTGSASNDIHVCLTWCRQLLL